MDGEKDEATRRPGHKHEADALQRVGGSFLTMRRNNDEVQACCPGRSILAAVRLRGSRALLIMTGASPDQDVSSEIYSVNAARLRLMPATDIRRE